METKKWLIGIIALMFILSIPVLFVAWGMTWKWTSFAPGKTDAWLGFWGGYLGAIIGALAAGAIAYFVARRQINLQAEIDNKREKQFLVTQLRIEKYQEAYSLLSDLNREFAISQHLVLNYFHKKITLEVLRDKEDQCQQNVMMLTRKINSLEPFIKNLKEAHDIIKSRYWDMGNIIYDGYTYPGSKKRFADDTTIDTFKEVSHELMMYTVNFCDEINGYLKNEVDKLERES
ncbi:hypothetical protein [Priestia megaterium]|uniref:hypothetical protein n=1 Tax=Priestia megaterium TaxID=1404 RepID=UPI000BEDA270|nr:hypothetical protein [Priestia megaterium]MED4064423.1 hypothetical protein [Priestia megaterium]PEA38465.1 hypothetical protein CON45_12720 [Priestia megaterium]